VSRMSETTCESVPSAAFPRLRSRWDVVGAPEDRDAWVPAVTLGLARVSAGSCLVLFAPGVMVANVPYHLTSSYNLIAFDAPPSIDGSEVSRHQATPFARSKRHHDSMRMFFGWSAAWPQVHHQASASASQIAGSPASSG
jgi:hypothetical protein